MNAQVKIAGPPLWLLLELTYRCPLHCAFCYNPTDYDVWVYIVISPTGAQPGMQPTFPIRVYAHNHAYYEAMTSALSVPPGEIFSIAVSSSEISLTWNSNPVYLAVRHT